MTNRLSAGRSFWSTSIIAFSAIFQNWRLPFEPFVGTSRAQLYLLNNEPGARWQQQLRIHGPPVWWPSDPPGRNVLPGQTGSTQPTQPNLDILVCRGETLDANIGGVPRYEKQPSR
jgi:hypothetical protein